MNELLELDEINKNDEEKEAIKYDKYYDPFKNYSLRLRYILKIAKFGSYMTNTARKLFKNRK